MSVLRVAIGSCYGVGFGTTLVVERISGQPTTRLSLAPDRTEKDPEPRMTHVELEPAAVRAAAAALLASVEGWP